MNDLDLWSGQESEDAQDEVEATSPESRTIFLQEFGRPVLASLSREEFDILTKHFAKYVGVTYDFPSGKFSLAATHYVGVIQVGDLRIRVVPKTPAMNLFYMFTYAYDLPIEWNDLTELQEGEDIFEFIVKLFVQQVEELVHQGIFRSYQSLDDSLPYLRGRIRIADQIRREITAPGRFSQELHDYTADVVHNRILLWTLHRLSRLPWRSPFLNQHVRRVEQVFAEVLLSPVQDSDFDSIVYTRLNDAYLSRHRLARLLLQMHSIEGSQGLHNFNSWLLDMNQLFELFVAHYLEEYIDEDAALRSLLRIELQERVVLDPQRDEDVYPDITIKHGSRSLLVLDTKNKILKHRPDNDDRRQMREYANILHLEDAWLIYSGGAATRPSREYSGLLPFTLHTLVWNLDGALDQFRVRCRETAERLVKIAMARVRRLGRSCWRVELSERLCYTARSET